MDDRSRDEGNAGGLKRNCSKPEALSGKWWPCHPTQQIGHDILSFIETNLEENSN
jgi:hypothetical protein